MTHLIFLGSFSILLAFVDGREIFIRPLDGSGRAKLLVQARRHLVLRQRYELVQVDAPSGKPGTCVSWHEPVVKRRRDRQLCAPGPRQDCQRLRRATRCDLIENERRVHSPCLLKSKRVGSSRDGAF